MGDLPQSPETPTNTASEYNHRDRTVNGVDAPRNGAKKRCRLRWCPLPVSI